MEIISQRQIYLRDRRAKALDVWRQVVSEYNAGVPVAEIAASHVSPETGRHYAKSRIYGILREMRKIE